MEVDLVVVLFSSTHLTWGLLWDRPWGYRGGKYTLRPEAANSLVREDLVSKCA